MPSRIEELIAEWRKFADTDYTKGTKLGDSRKQAQYELMMAGQSLAYATAAQNLERAYCEEVVPLVEALRMISTLHMEYDPERNLTYDLGTVDGHRCAARFALEALRRFDAPAGTDPKQ